MSHQNRAQTAPHQSADTNVEIGDTVERQSHHPHALCANTVMFENVKRSMSNPGLLGKGSGKLTKRSDSVSSLPADYDSFVVVPVTSTTTGKSAEPGTTGSRSTSQNDPVMVRNATSTSNYTSSTLSSAGALVDNTPHIVHVSVGDASNKGHSEQENHAKRGSESSQNSNDASARTGGTGGQVSTGNWGWFEDVHYDTGGVSLKEASNLVDQSSKDDTNNDDRCDADYIDNDGTEKGTGGARPKLKGGLLQFGQVMVRPLNDVKSNDTTSSMAVSAPNYVLEESISNQMLWKHTAGHRPPQPVEERAFYEKVWAQNFLKSEVKYQLPVDVLTASSPISLSPYADGGFSDSADAGGFSNYNIAGQFNANLFGGGGGDKTRNKAAEADVAEATIMHRSKKASHKGKEIDLHAEHAAKEKAKGPSKQVDGALSVLIKGDNVFGTTVSKSFARPDRPGTIDTISVSIASYRVVQSKKHGKYAQFLVVYREGSFQDTVGVWKRYSDFDSLSRKVTAGEEGCSDMLSGMHPLSVDEDKDTELLPNAITSWRLLKKRQRWYRCLDAGYLSLKVFLLERFLHDILFECTNPNILRDFIGVDFMQ